MGSLAKDTHLSEPLDVDLFLLFPPATPRERLEAEGLALGKAVVPTPVLKYAEHPYVHGTIGGIDVDIVPAYRLRSAAGRLSAVDRTPFHTLYVKQHASARARREIRLLKRWLRGTKCYGAETATGGVSGYLAELLVLKHGSFDRVVAAVADWKAPVEIALHGRVEVPGTPLVVVDPVDPSRNAAAAVSTATFDRLVRAARAYAKSPRLEFFFPREPAPAPPARLRALLGREPTVGLLVPAPQGRPETVLPQGQRLAAKVARALEAEGFEVPRLDVSMTRDGRLLLLWRHEPAALAATHLHRGPPAGDGANAARFHEKWAQRPDRAGPPRVVHGRWFVPLRRAKRTPKAILGDGAAGFLEGFEFDAKAVRSARFLAGAELLDERELATPLTVFLRRVDPWDA